MSQTWYPHRPTRRLVMLRQKVVTRTAFVYEPVICLAKQSSAFLLVLHAGKKSEEIPYGPTLIILNLATCSLHDVCASTSGNPSVTGFIQYMVKVIQESKMTFPDSVLIKWSVGPTWREERPTLPHECARNKHISGSGVTLQKVALLLSPFSVTRRLPVWRVKYL